MADTAPRWGCGKSSAATAADDGPLSRPAGELRPPEPPQILCGGPYWFVIQGGNWGPYWFVIQRVSWTRVFMGGPPMLPVFPDGLEFLFYGGYPPHEESVPIPSLVL